MKTLPLLGLAACWLLSTDSLGQAQPTGSPVIIQTRPFANAELPKNYKPEIVPVYFLLGTLSDYMGRFQYVEREKQVDRYYPYEKPLARYLAAYAQQQLQLKVDTTFEQSGHGRLDSPALANMLNQYYNSRGMLTDSLFRTEAQLNSFLLGNYYRYGRKLSEKVYKIQLANTQKGRLLAALLQRAGCDRILFKFLHNIPAQTIFYFEPTPVLKRYLDSIEAEQHKLHEAFITQVMNMLSLGKEKELKQLEELADYERKEAKTIEAAF
ncbi:MAG: hypothetical protein EOO60_13345 [Hymenobacter sp.]|nr:MAG: hypothetical protein EOO60_13345 [Hymenobacter sp.]